MTARPDLALPLHPASSDDATEAVSAGPWGMLEREPSDLIALWPRSAGDAPPTLDDLLSLLERHFGTRPEITDPNVSSRDPAILWTAALRLPSGQNLLLWVETMREISTENIEFLKAQGVKWVVGVETVLNLANPLGDFLPLLKMLARGIPDSPAILNVNLEGWHARDELDDDIFMHDIEPRTSILWMTHGISDGPDENAGAWLYTRGLNRCGLPELEMLNVPVHRARTAVGFLNTLAELVFERGMPQPGEAFEIGADLEVVFQPWREAAATIPEEVRGSIKKREGHDHQLLTGARAAVCATELVNGQWVWPEEVLDRMEGEEPATLYQTAHETECRAKRARITWDDFARAFTAVHGLASQPRSTSKSGEAQPELVIKAGFERPGIDLIGSPPDREHLWFEVMRFDGQRVQGRLLNQPMFVPGLRRGDVRWIERDRLSDWRVTIPQCQSSFGPEHIKPMRKAIFALKSVKP